jgi:hypothetical protein
MVADQIHWIWAVIFIAFELIEVEQCENKVIQAGILNKHKFNTKLLNPLCNLKFYLFLSSYLTMTKD